MSDDDKILQLDPFAANHVTEEEIRRKAKEALRKSEDLSDLGKGLLTVGGIALVGLALNSLLSGKPRRFRASSVSTARDVGEAIRLRRKDLGLTQRELAEKSGTGERFISEIERGKETAELGKVLDLLDALGLETRLAAKG